jgi:hypothetical protein
MIRSYATTVLVVLLLAGCAEPTPGPKPTASSESQTSNGDSVVLGGTALPEPEPSVSSVAGEPAAGSELAPATERVAAGVGVGRRGRSLDQFQNDAVQSAISTPAREYFRAKERIVFEIAVPHALSLYKAEHGHGPKTHEQFLAEIVEFNNIQLPDLPAGHRYVYDPETEQLMVEKPAAGQ